MTKKVCILCCRLINVECTREQNKINYILRERKCRILINQAINKTENILRGLTK